MIQNSLSDCLFSVPMQEGCCCPGMSTYRTCAVTKQHSIMCLPTLKDGEAAGFKQMVGHRPFGEIYFQKQLILIVSSSS